MVLRVRRVSLALAASTPAALPDDLLRELPLLSLEETVTYLRQSKRFVSVDFLEQALFAGRRGPGARRPRYRALLGILRRELASGQFTPLEIRWLSQRSGLGEGTVHRALLRLRALGVLVGTPSKAYWEPIRQGFAGQAVRYRLQPWTLAAAEAVGALPEAAALEARLVAWGGRNGLWAKRIRASFRSGHAAQLWHWALRRRKLLAGAPAEDADSRPTPSATPRLNAQQRQLQALVSTLAKGKTFSWTLTGTQKEIPSFVGDSPGECSGAKMPKGDPPDSGPLSTTHDEASIRAQVEVQARQIGDSAPSVTHRLVLALSATAGVTARTAADVYERYCAEARELGGLLRKPSAWAFWKTRQTLTPGGTSS